MKFNRDLKAVLRDEAIPTLTAARPYFSMMEVRSWLTRRQIPWTAATLNSYLHAFTNAGWVYDAGRGWYSTLAKRGELDRSVVTPVVELIEQAFPLLTFAVWSTHQVNPWMHHLLGKFVTFVYVEKESVSPVWELLKENGYDAHRDPTKKEAAKTFSVREKTVVVRAGSLSQAPIEGHYASLEKLLVDLAGEIESLPLMSPSEYAGMFSSVTQAGRLDVPTMLRYASRKELRERVLELMNQTPAENGVS
jgi:hypothetical protein